ncbi:hypothetical protein HBI25_206570 [Parastagonospora nodorum]|nr:hypothetical protein HBI76_190320 [Parastagonospora nodorum]KAH5145253.1 hypothetical protein HBH69_185850 [Parastagonospora nodorum]KAH5444748.1 hypothetical protein HBI30_207230 [Parastagonospora nodorum]KAH5547895.1 hypothetical protein HBI25_206570 [Parastagonospora nodorum]KAH5643258.1 hypothetical protein HBI23_195380 [Parastagonospora nodorum]
MFLDITMVFEGWRQWPAQSMPLDVPEGQPGHQRAGCGQGFSPLTFLGPRAFFLASSKVPFVLSLAFHKAFEGMPLLQSCTAYVKFFTLTQFRGWAGPQSRDSVGKSLLVRRLRESASFSDVCPGWRSTSSCGTGEGVRITDASEDQDTADDCDGRATLTASDCKLCRFLRHRTTKMLASNCEALIYEYIDL